MKSFLLLCKNLGRITFLELLWGLRVPESVVYNFLLPTLILVILGLIQSGQGYLHILVPGMIALTTASSAMQGVGTTTSYMRAFGNWRTLRASPIPTPLYFAGLICSRVVRTLLIVSFMLLVAYFLFGYRIRGSVILTLVYVFIGSLVFAALGLAIAYMISSPQSVSGALNVVFLPMFFTSNALFISHVPWVKTVSLFFPLVFLVDLIRDISRDAIGSDTWRNLGALFMWFVIYSLIALFFARRRVEEK